MIEKPKCKLIGKDGNIFNLMGIAARTLRRAQHPELADELIHRITQGEAKDYSMALAIISEYVEVE